MGDGRPPLSAAARGCATALSTKISGKGYIARAPDRGTTLRAGHLGRQRSRVAHRTRCPHFGGHTRLLTPDRVTFWGGKRPQNGGDSPQIGQTALLSLFVRPTVVNASCWGTLVTHSFGGNYCEALCFSYCRDNRGAHDPLAIRWRQRTVAGRHRLRFRSSRQRPQRRRRRPQRCRWRT